MWEPSEMITASRMQNMVKILKKTIFRDHIIFLNFEMLEEFCFLF